MLKQDDFLKSQLVSMAWRFGKPYGGYKAGVLIMHTLMNRVRLGWGNVAQIIEGVPRFMAENEMPPLEFPPLWEPAFVKLLHAVEGIYDGSLPDESTGALYWCDLGKIERAWFKEKIVDSRGQDPHGEGIVPVHKRVHDMGTLVFFA